MLKPLSVLVTAVCFALPCAAWADVYPVPSVPLPAGPAPQRLSPRQVFHLLDTNHDGFLSLQEFLSAPWIKNKPRAARFFRWMDTDRDGLVTLPEFLAAYARYRGPSGYTIQVAYPWPGLAGGPGITAGIGSADGITMPGLRWEAEERLSAARIHAPAVHELAWRDRGVTLAGHIRAWRARGGTLPARGLPPEFVMPGRLIRSGRIAPSSEPGRPRSGNQRGMAAEHMATVMATPPIAGIAASYGTDETNGA